MLRAFALYLSSLPPVVFYVFMAVICALPLFFSLSPKVEPGSEVLKFSGIIDTLPVGKPVLAVFAYDNGARAEMEPLAQTVLAHVFEHGAKVIAVGTLPDAALLQRDAVSHALAVSSQSRRLRQQEDYAFFGYLPGGVVAARALAAGVSGPLSRDISGTRFSDIPALKGVKTLQDFSAVLVFASRSEEALPAPFAFVMASGGKDAPPVLAAVSAALSVDMLPLKKPDRLAAVIAGIKGAAEYETCTSREKGDAPARLLMGAQTAALLFIILVIMAANLPGIRRERIR